MSRSLRCLLVASFLAPLTAQEVVEKVVLKPAPQSLPARAVPGRAFVLEAGELTMEELVDAAAQYLNRNILLTPSELGSTPAAGPPRGGKPDVPPIRLQNRVELDAVGCEEMLSSMLQARGFALTPLDAQRNLWDVVAIAGPRAREIQNRAIAMSPEEVLRRPMLKIAVSTTIELQHGNANNVINALRQVMGNSGVAIGSTGNAHSMVLLGCADQVAAAIRMVRDTDRPGRPDQPPELVVRVQQHDQQIQSLQQQLAKKADKPEQ